VVHPGGVFGPVQDESSSSKALSKI
jgi:hypothetical protein